MYDHIHGPLKENESVFELSTKLNMYTQKFLSKVLTSYMDRIALSEPGKTMDYAELNKKATQVMAFIQTSGCEELSRIGVCLRETSDLVISMIGIMQARCVFVPLDTSQPRKRLERIVEQAKLKAILTSEETRGHMDWTGLDTWELEKIMSLNLQLPYIHTPDYQEDDSLYIYFTSGSTGTSKGIIGKNKSLWHFLEWEIQAFGIPEGKRFSQLISPYFDAFLRDIFVPLLSGGTICVPPRNEEGFPSIELPRWIEEQRINLIHCVPSVFRLLNNTSLTAASYPFLEHVLLSGEKIIPRELNNWYGTLGSRIQLVNLYGATEATMISTYHIIQPEDRLKVRIPIGNPISNSEAVILDANHKVCETGEIGDLWILSSFLSKGYLGNQDLTTNRFIRINGITKGDQIAFKTGDKAIQLDDGTIDLLGREDRMIKLRGIRIELDEIETNLGNCTGVQRGIAVYNENLQLIEAYVTGLDSLEKADIFTEQVLVELKEYVPAYMVPSRITLLDTIPTLTNGKVDYEQLTKTDRIDKIENPSNGIEEGLRTIWSDVLGIEEELISVTRSFFEYGGSSLNSISIVNNIVKKFEINFSVKEILQGASIRKLAEVIEAISQVNTPDIDDCELTEISF